MRICDVRGCKGKNVKTISLKAEDQVGLLREDALEALNILVRYDWVVDLCPKHKDILDKAVQQSARIFRAGVNSLLQTGSFEIEFKGRR